MSPFKNILVPTDFSETSEHALVVAVDLAVTFRAHLTLLHVWSMPSVGYAEALAWPIGEMERAAKEALDTLYARVQKRHAPTEAVLRFGLEWQQILEVTKEHGIDLVVMGTHGRRGLPRLVLGSVTEKVVRLSTVPVLTLGAPPDPEKRL